MDSQKKKPVLLSAVQPSGNLTIANYIGAISHWVRLQENCDCFFVIADLHAITVKQDPSGLLRRCCEFFALYLACGIDPRKSTLFAQSHVPAHAQLAWVLNCFTRMGELSRMTQFKDKAKLHPKEVNAGLFAYPVLMAADILLYGTDRVPVGSDQKQHLELARDIALRFNHRCGPVFTVPEPIIPETGARIMSLQDPLSKMSKSDDAAANYIALLDPPEVVRRKIKSAVTDPGREIRFDVQDKPGISNLMTIFSILAGKTLTAIEERYAGKGYGIFKEDLAEITIEFLRPIQMKYMEISEDRARLLEILTGGAEAARKRSAPMLEKVHTALGLVPAG